MTEEKQSTTITIINPQGLHMRPAYLFAEMASRFSSRIEVVKDDMRIDGKSVLSILTLGATQGTQIAVEAFGPDARAAVAQLVQLVTSGFPDESGKTEAEASHF